MSIQTMQAVWQHSKAEGRARLVLLAIADHQGEIGAWPSIATLAKMVNASNRSVQRDIAELHRIGELDVQIQSAPTSRQYKSNLYWVTLPGVTESASGVTDNESGVTESASGVTAGGVRTLKRTTTKPLRESSTSLPIEWQPKEQDIDTMREHFPDVDLKLETHAFRDYWLAVPGARSKKSDWDATWRNWIRKSYTLQQTNHKPKTDWDKLDKWAKDKDDKDAN